MSRVAPAGSRGDVQPLLALALGLRTAGHEVLTVVTPDFEAEAKTFGLPVKAIGFVAALLLAAVLLRRAPAPAEDDD